MENSSNIQQALIFLCSLCEVSTGVGYTEYEQSPNVQQLYGPLCYTLDDNAELCATIYTQDWNAGNLIEGLLKTTLELTPQQDFIRHHAGMRGGSKWIEILTPEALEKLKEFLNRLEIERESLQRRTGFVVTRGGLIFHEFNIAESLKERSVIEVSKPDIIEGGFLCKILGAETIYSLEIKAEKFDNLREAEELYQPMLLDWLEKMGAKILEPTMENSKSESECNASNLNITIRVGGLELKQLLESIRSRGVGE